MKLTYAPSILAVAAVAVAFPKQVIAAKNTVPTYLFQMKGTAAAEMRPNPIDPTQELPCFDVPLHDLVTGEQVGMGTDCLNVAEDQESCNGLEVTAATVFNLAEGSITLQGLTSVQPTTFGSSEVTHITGAIPAEGENSIVAGDGIYDNTSGSVRLSGAVNMAKLESAGQATFDCLWVVYLDNPLEDDMMGDVAVSKAVKSTTDGDTMSTQRLVLQMKGTATAEMKPNPLDETQTLPCFDVPLVDLTTGETIGMGTDCLDVAGPDECGALQVSATTTFQFDRMNYLIATGETSVQPTTFGSPDATHITGAIPASTGGENIEAGAGIYEDATGTVRLSGAVNMAELETKGEATFDCLWVMDVTKQAPDSMGDTTSSAVNSKRGLRVVVIFHLLSLVSLSI